MLLVRGAGGCGRRWKKNARERPWWRCLWETKPNMPYASHINDKVDWS